MFYGVRQTGKTEGTTRTVGRKAGDSRKIDMVLTPKAGVDAGTYTITVETLQQGSSDVKGTISYTMVVE